MGKSEYRIPKSETNPKSERRSPDQPAPVQRNKTTEHAHYAGKQPFDVPSAIHAKRTLCGSTHYSSREAFKAGYKSAI